MMMGSFFVIYVNRSYLMSEYLISLLFGFTFIAGFWVGVDWYRKKIIKEAIGEKKTRR
tara:strand:- start:110 stop:283 length:174 start_codon:yes stop_codon:yes gene_type:complete